MFCPNCGAQAIDGQKFCKTCGTNLELVSDALEGGEDTLGQLRLDIEALKSSAKNFGKGMHWAGPNWRDQAAEKPHRKDDPRLPKPKEWLSYSWQHSLKNGLLSLFGGAGLGIVLYYLGQIMINDGVIRSIEEASNRPIQGLESLARWAWMFALIPVLKGISQIIYAALFAESMATLAARFAPPPVAYQDIAPNNTAPIVPSLDEPPPSVTEHTTRMFEAQSQPRRESQ
jgi:hypothetical protein